MFSYDDFGDFDIVEYILEYRTKTNKNGRRDQYFPSNIIERILSVAIAMRLFHNGDLALYSISRLISLDIPFVPANLNLNVISLSSNFGYYYELKKSEVPRFKNFWNDYGEILFKILTFKRSTMEDFRIIGRALDLFNSAFSKGDGNDCFMDLTRAIIISLTSRHESFPKNQTRIIQRCSLILNKIGDTGMQQKELRHIFKKYGSIIQGGEIEELDLIELEEIARSVLVYYLKQIKFFGLNHEQIIKNLI